MQASRRLSSADSGESLRRVPVSEPGGAQLSRCPRVGGNGSHKAPPSRASSGSAVGRRGARAPRALSAHPQGSSTGREEKKQQPPHRSGRARGSWSLPRFPQLQTAGNGNDATSTEFPASTVTRKLGSKAAGEPSPGHGLPRPSGLLRLVHAPPIADAARRSDGVALTRARILGPRDGFPSNGPRRHAPRVDDQSS